MKFFGGSIHTAV